MAEGESLVICDAHILSIADLLSLHADIAEELWDANEC